MLFEDDGLVIWCREHRDEHREGMQCQLENHELRPGREEVREKEI